ncbi:MAG TPA: methyltransferase [Streptosporangiaceae bacterium]|jgi:hypothetical protein
MPEPAADLPLPTQMYVLTTGTWVSQAISVAATLGVPDELAAGPRAVTDLASSVRADPPALYRLLRALADIHLVDELGGRTFALTALGGLLRSDVPGSMRSWAIMVGRPFHRSSWTDLVASVRTGKCAFERVHGRGAFDYLRDHPEDGKVLNDAMTAAAGQFITPLVDSYDFSALGTVVDVGGGHGALLAAVLAASPGVRGILFDLPEVIAGAGAPLREAGVADRCACLGGDFFQSVPPGGDAYLLSNIIHDWDDERAVQILSRCRAAVGAGGRVLLGEAVLPGACQPSPANWIDLEMLVMGSGRQRTETEYRELLRRAGLSLARVIPSHEMFQLVEATPV